MTLLRVTHWTKPKLAHHHIQYAHTDYHLEPARITKQRVLHPIPVHLRKPRPS